MAVDVGSAKGYLDLDISGFLSGLKSAQSEADSASKNIANKIGGALDTIGGKMTAIGGFATAGITTPIATAVTASVKQFANLEQSIGGVETLFKDSAGIIIKNAENAYMTAGVDANNYMEQVTSFSATLLQGLGGDTVKAAEYADKAIVDMSDNANKFGTDIGLIQNAYQGFAKDNYSMLDNLKLGYGGTASEMARLVNDSGVLNGEFEATAENIKDIPFDVLIEAIHKTQENLGIMGATSAEARETVSGSFTMMKASVLNFLQQLGNPGADMTAFKDAMLESIGVFVSNVKRVLSTIWENLPITDLQKKLLVAAAAFGPVMIAGGKVVSTVGKIVTGVNNAIPVIKNFSAGFKAAGTTLGQGAPIATKLGAAIGGITGPMIAVVAAIALVIAAFVSLWKNNEEFRNKIIAIWGQVKATFEKLCKGIVDRLNQLGFDFSSISEVLKAIWKGFCDFLAPIFEGVFQYIADTFDTIVDVILGVLDFFISVFKGDWRGAWNAIKGIFESVWTGMVKWFKNIGNTLLGVLDVVCGWFGTTWSDTWSSIKTFFENVWNNIVTWFKTTLTNISTFFTDVWTSVSTFFKNLWNSISSFVVSVLGTIKATFTNIWNNIVSFLTSAWDTICNVVKTGILLIASLLDAAFQIITLPFRFIWENCKETIISIWNAIKTTISNTLTAIQNVITTAWNAVKSFFSTVWNAISTIVSTIWNTIKTTITNALNAIKTTITNVFNAVKTIVTNIFNAIKTIITNVWNAISTATTNVWNAIKTFVSTVLNAIKTTITNIFNAVKTTITNAWNAIKTTTTSVWNSIKTAVSNAINSAKSTVSSVVDSIKKKISDGFNSAKSTVSSVFDSISSKISSVMESAKTTVSNAIEKVKGMFNFTWSLPHISLPHFAITPSGWKFGDLLKGTIPKLSIEWYAKAMNSGMILNSPTIFGYDAKTGQFLGGGEAGSETVVGTSNLMAMIRQAVNGAIQPIIAVTYKLASTAIELGYVTHNGFVKQTQVLDKIINTNNPSNGDTFNFYSPKPIDEIEAARQMKKAKRDLAEGF